MIKTKRIICIKPVLLSVFMMVFHLQAQEKLEMLLPFFQDGKYGFADEKGKFKLQAKYELAFPFFESFELTMVVQNGKGMIINRKGKIIANALPDYMDEALPLNQQNCFNQKTENVAIDSYCLSDSCGNYSVLFRPNPKYFFDKMGDLYFVRSGGKVFLIDRKGKEQSKRYDRMRHYHAGEIEYVLTEDRTLNKFGLINQSGKELLSCNYDKIIYAGNGVFNLIQSGKTYPYKTTYNESYKPNELPAKQYDKNRIVGKKDGKYGLTDSLKNEILNYEFNRLYPVSSEIYLFWKGDSVGVLELKNDLKFEIKLVIPIKGSLPEKQFVPFVPFTNQLVFFNNSMNWTLATVSGRIILRDIDGIVIDFQKVAGEFVALSKNGEIGLIDYDGQLIVPVDYAKIEALPDKNGFIVFADNKLSWLDRNGKPIYSGFSDYKYLIAGYLYVNKDSKWYFIDKNGLEFKK